MTAARELGSLIEAQHFAAAQELAERWLLDPERHIEGVEAAALVDAARGQFEHACRWSDRGTRITRRSASAWSLHGVACLQAGRDSEAEQAFTRALHYRANAADAVSGLAVTLNRRDPAAAASFLAEFLQRSSVSPDGAVANAAAEILRGSAGKAEGWIGRAGGWRLTGRLLPGRSMDDLVLALDGKPAEIETVETVASSGDAGLGFTLAIRPQNEPATLSAAVRGRLLIGSGVSLPGRRSCDGEVRRTEDRIAGWVRDAGYLGLLDIVISDSNGARLLLPGSLSPSDPGGRQTFDLGIADSGLNPSVLLVEAGLSRTLLAGSPLIGPAAPLRLLPPKRSLRGLGARRVYRPVATIVVIRDESADVVRCLTALQSHRPARSKLVILDSGSSSAQQRSQMRGLAVEHAIEVSRQESGGSLVRMLNRVIEGLSGHDITLVDAGTAVGEGLVQRLAKAAYSQPGVATVSALSNEAGPLGYPSHAVPEDKWDDASLASSQPSHAQVLTRNEDASALFGGRTAEIPLGSEFCLYIRRDCLQQIGPFEENAFGVGPGAIADFCARAGARGWRHLVALDAYVGHGAGESADPEAQRRRLASTAMLEARNPGITDAIARWMASDPLRPVRRSLDLAQFREQTDRPTVLLVTAALGGGVVQHVEERRKEHERNGRRILELRSDGDPEGAGDAWLVDPVQPDLVDVRFDLGTSASLEKDLLIATLRRMRVEAIEVHHTVGYRPAVFDLPEWLGLPYAVVLHDYALICPQIVLIDETRRYCGEPDTAVCETCLAKNGSKIGPIQSVARLRQQSRSFLEGAATVRVATQDARRRIARYAPAAKIVVTAWDASRPARPAQALTAPAPERRRRIAVIGGIALHKGSELLLRCAEDAAARDLPLEFVLIGYSQIDPALFATHRVFVTGPYENAELPALLARERCDLAFFPSVWPETWCYAMSEAWKAALPILAFDHGAIAERIRQHGGGFLMPLTLEGAAINDRLLQLKTIVADPQPQRDLPQTVPAPPQSSPVSAAPSPQISASPVLSQHFEVSVQVFPVNPGIYSMNLTHRKVPSVKSFGLTVPCMHIGIPPGQEGEANPVELISMSDARKNWLTEPGDVVVVKVTKPGGHLIATTYALPQQPKGALSFQMRRLDERGTAVRQEVRTEVILHVERAGDQRFSGGWAGFKDRGLRIEAFTIRPLEKLAPTDLEFMAYGALKRETPWVTGDKFCGSRGQGIALLGFAVRVAAKERNRFDVVYEGAFRDAGVVGPKQNGEPCVSPREDDALEGIRVQLLERVTA